MKTDDIVLKGESIESFERLEGISEIILLGNKGGIRRIILNDVFGDQQFQKETEHE